MAIAKSKTMCPEQTICVMITHTNTVHLSVHLSMRTDRQTDRQYHYNVKPSWIQNKLIKQGTNSMTVLTNSLSIAYQLQKRLYFQIIMQLPIAISRVVYWPRYAWCKQYNNVNQPCRSQLRYYFDLKSHATIHYWWHAAKSNMTSNATPVPSI